MPELNRLRKSRLAKAQIRRRLATNELPEERPNLLMRATGAWSVLRSVVLNVVGALVFLGVLYLLYQRIASPTIEVMPISVPKDLTDKGYASDAVTLELREALVDLKKQARTGKRTASVGNQKDEPTITVPETGLSLDTIAAEIRSRFRIGNSWRVSGSIESDGTLYNLNISIDNEREFRKLSIPENIDVAALCSSAAISIFEVVDL